MQAVEAIETVRDELLHPKAVLSVLGDPKPITARPEDTVAAALRTMYQNDFSQMPVYNGKQYHGLLTTNTVARQLADQLERHNGLAEDVPVQDPLAFVEGIENVLHRPRNLSVTETVWEFTTAAANGRPVTALILTNNGMRDELPLGIVVAEDLARLSRYHTPRGRATSIRGIAPTVIPNEETPRLRLVRTDMPPIGQVRIRFVGSKESLYSPRG